MRPPPEHPLRWLGDRVERAPDSAAVAGDQSTLSYGELWDSLGGWSRLLRAAGLEPGRPTAIITGSRSRLARALWLAIYNGLPLLTMNPSQTQVGRLMRRCGVRQAITDAALQLPAGVRRLPARPLDRRVGGLRVEPSPVDTDQAQLLVPTSGTEGPARAVMLSCRNIASAAFSTNRILGLESHDRWLCALPLTHVAGIMILMRCAAAGATVQLQEKFDPRRVAAAFREHRTTHISLVPAMLHRLVEAGADPSGLDVALVGGSGISDHLAASAVAAGWPLKLAYGLTETTAHVAIGDLCGPDRALTPQPGTRIEIVNPDDPSPRGIGWIQVAGPTVMLGYANPELIPGEGLAARQTFRTQDLGKLDEDGRLLVLGRGDDVLISGGLNVHPAQVEDLLAACPGVAEIAVTGIPDPVWGTRLLALYCGDADEDSVSAWADENVPGPLRPREYRRVARLPRTPLGKIRRRDLDRLV